MEFQRQSKVRPSEMDRVALDGDRVDESNQFLMKKPFIFSVRPGTFEPTCYRAPSRVFELTSHS